MLDILKREFVSYQQSLDLNELGFDEECFGRYVEGELLNYKDHNDDSYHFSCEIISAPLYQQAFRWFREKFKYFSEIFMYDDGTFGYLISTIVKDGRIDMPIQRSFNNDYASTEKLCLQVLIDTIKNDK